MTKTEQRKAERRLRLLRWIDAAGADGTFIAHTGQWLSAVKMCDEGLLSKKMAVQRMRIFATGRREEHHAPRFFLTDKGRQEIVRLQSALSDSNVAPAFREAP